MLKALFLDRDGVINHDPGYVYEVQKLKLIDGIIEVIIEANLKNYLVIVITNQAGIAKKKFTLHDMENFHKNLILKCYEKGAIIDDIIFCPHHPNGIIPEYKKDCMCRKPNPGMILNAAKRFNIDLVNSILIGDKKTDIDAGHSAGIKNLFLFKELTHRNKKYFQEK